jgi:hypothetical protein
MGILKLFLLIFFGYIFFELFFGNGSLNLRLGKKEKPILRLKIGRDEDAEKEEGPI